MDKIKKRLKNWNYVISFLIISILFTFLSVLSVFATEPKLEITTDKKNNLLDIDSKLIFTVKSFEPQDTEIDKKTLKVNLSDFFHNTIFESEKEINVADDNKLVTLEKDIIFTQPGFYKLSVSSNQGKILKETTIGVLPHLKDFTKDSPFAINFGTPEIMAHSGIKWTRINIGWASVESEKGKFNFSKIDKMINGYRASDINILAILANPPQWARKIPPNYKGITDGVHKGWGDFPPNDIDAWGRYVYETVTHFKDRVKYWEIWNEPWPNTLFFNGGTIEDYINILKSAYTNAKKADAEAKIVGLGGTDWFHAQQVFAAGGFPYMDIGSIHIYQPGASPENGWFVDVIEKAKNVVEKYGGGKEIWITESGWSTNKGISEGWTGISVDENAKYIVRAMVLALSLGVKKFFWFAFGDGGTDSKNFEHNQGIMYFDSTPKPSLVSYAVLIRILQNLDYAETLKFGKKIYAFRFANKEKNCFVIWSTMLKEVSTNIPSSIVGTQIFNLMGQEIELKNSNLTISRYPIYIVTKSIEDTEKIKEIILNTNF